MGLEDVAQVDRFGLRDILLDFELLSANNAEAYRCIWASGNPNVYII
jgi:hypothetical protein